MKRAFGRSAARLAAAAAESGRSYRKAFIGRARSEVGAGGVADRRDDVRVGATAAEIAAHALADLRVREGDLGGQVLGDVARPAGPHLGEHPGRRADLARRAVAALVAVMV